PATGNQSEPLRNPGLSATQVCKSSAADVRGEASSSARSRQRKPLCHARRHPFRPPKERVCPSGQAIPVWLLGPCEGANLHNRKDKKMNSESIKKVTKEAIEQLAAALNAGQSEALTRYLAAIARFRSYSFLNVLLILKACPTAKRVAGYKTWQSFGRHVKKGEKGIMILAPMFRKKAENSEECETNDFSRKLSGFRPVYVWDEQQTTGNELPEIGSVTGDPTYYLARLEQFVQSTGIVLEYSAHIASAQGMAQKGKITFPPNQTPAEAFATLVHEMAHSDMHFGERRAQTSKRVRETEAESVAFVVCSAIGLDTGTAAQDYVGLYGGDSKLLLESLEYIQASASRILDAIELKSEQQAA